MCANSGYEKLHKAIEGQALMMHPRNGFGSILDGGDSEPIKRRLGATLQQSD